MRSRGRASLPASSRPRQTTRPVAWTYAQIDAWIRPMDRLKWESVLRARGWPRGNPETQPNALQLLAHDEYRILTRMHSSAYTRVRLVCGVVRQSHRDADRQANDPGEADRSRGLLPTRRTDEGARR